jgi:hypothetical protein
LASQLCLFFLLAFAYANARRLSPTERLDRVNLVSFELKGELNESERNTLETKIKSESGVTACAISKERNLATVIFHPKQISRETLAVKFAALGKMDAVKIELPTTGGCQSRRKVGCKLAPLCSRSASFI